MINTYLVAQYHGIYWPIAWSLVIDVVDEQASDDKANERNNSNGNGNAYSIVSSNVQNFLPGIFWFHNAYCFIVKHLKYGSHGMPI